MKNNQEILELLRANRDISDFARFLGISNQGLYRLLDSKKAHKNQYGNYVEFIKRKYENA